MGEMMAQQIEFPLMMTVCAWCRPRELGAGLGALSHGICPRHLRKIKLELKRTARIAPKRSPRRRQIMNRPGAEVMFLPL
jgi:hypothetical protein